MPQLLPDTFSWGVGIEDTFVPHARPGMRPLDEYELTAHYRLWREDFALLAQLGVTHMRWGVPWYRVNPAPGHWDWEWVDSALDYLVNTARVTPIVDLMHYGTPGWLENAFINHAYPERVAEYAAEFAARYGHLVRYYTPLNEPLVNALYCGKRGEWPPYLEGDDGYVKVLIPVCRGIVLTTEALRAAQPDAVIVQVEAMEYHWSVDARLAGHISRERAQVHLPFDLCTGRVGEQHLLREFLLDNGVDDAQLAWFRERAIAVDIVGVNVYPFSGGEWVLGAQGTPELRRGIGLEQLALLLRDTWASYGLPIMITETSAIGSVEERARWMDGSIRVVREAIAEQLPIRGYTWWPMFDMVDWAYRLGEGALSEYQMDMGLWASRAPTVEALRRVPTPLVERYRAFIAGER